MSVEVPFLDRRIVRPSVTDCWIDERSVSGGMTITGAEQVVGIGLGIWRYTLSGIDLMRADQVRELRRFVTAMHGRANTTRVPFFERMRAPYPVDTYGRRLTPKLVRHPTLDGTPFADPPGVADSLIDARTVGDLAGNAVIPAGATGMHLIFAPITRTIDGLDVVFQPTLPDAGTIFSIGTQAFIIEQVLTTAGNNISFNSSPPVRTPIGSNSVADFTSPSVAMRFATDDQGRHALAQWKFGTDSLDIVEALG